jgi:hypothetical protein
MQPLKIRRLFRLCVLGMLFAAASHTPCQAAETIILVSSQETKDSLYGKWLDLIYTEAFRRLGYAFQYQGHSGGRAPVLAENGAVDGEIHRPDDYGKSAKNLLRVEEPSFSLSYVAYAAKPGIALQGWESLKNTDYAVEYRRGAKVPEAALPAVVKPENLSAIATAEQGLEKLILGRTDIYIEQEAVALETLKKLDAGVFDVSSLYQAGVMYTGYSYVYLHKKHAALVPQVAEVLKTMKQEGVIERYKQLALEQ